MGVVRRLVEIWAYGEHHLGFGHLRRAMSLAEYLGSDCAVRLRLNKSGSITVTNFACEPNEPPDLVVVDYPFPPESDVRLLKSRGLACLALDYFGFESPDLTISVCEHKSPLPPGRRVSGFEYVIIRPDVQAVRSKLEVGADHVLIVLGGGDILGQGPQVAERLASCGKRLLLVEGPFAKPSGPLPESCDRLVNPVNFPTLMQQCSWGVANGGGCLFELMYLGKAAFVVPQTQAELAVANLLMAKGGLLNVGLAEVRACSPSEIATVGRRASEIIDGDGLKRIARHIGELI